MMLNQRTVLKLRAGHTVWRCLIWCSGPPPFVDIEEIRLVGVQRKSRFTKGGRLLLRMRDDNDQSWYLSDIARAEAFTTRLGALNYRKEVLEGKHDARVQAYWESLHD
jgi:hypothetical protein